MSVDPKQLEKMKVIGCKVPERELQNIINPIMHDCYQLGLINHDTISSFVRFCIKFWIGHYRMKKQQFEMRQQEIEQEKKKLDAIIAEKEAWEKWDNSTPRVLEKTIKKLEEMGEQLEKEFAATSSSSSQQPQQPKPKQQQSVIDNLSLEDMMA
jgi:hypothetical protein